MKTSAMVFIRVLWNIALFFSKKRLHLQQFLETFGDEIIPTKNYAMDSYSSSSLFLSIGVFLQVIVENIRFETDSHDIQLY